MSLCDRCKNPNSEYTLMSIFNTDILCPVCKKAETLHPKYKEAVEAERKACLEDDYNYPGIGLPEDLK